MLDDARFAQMFARALSALGGGQVEEASRLADTLRQSRPEDAGVAQLLAAVALTRSEPAEAERWALASLAARPDHAATLVLAARAARALGRDADALARYRLAAQRAPTRADARFGVAALEIRLRDPAVAATVAGLETAFAEHASGWTEIGALFEQQHAWEHAASAYGLALRTTRSAKLFIRFGSVLQSLGRRAEAARAFEGAIRLDANAVEAWFKLGVTLQDGRQPGPAAQAYRRALALRPDLLEAQTNLGVVLQEAGDLPAAKQAYGRALALDPAVFGRIAQALSTAAHGELWTDLGALKAHLSEAARLSR